MTPSRLQSPSAGFHLKVKVGDGAWQGLPEVRLRRLKTAGQAACRELLKAT